MILCQVEYSDWLWYDNDKLSEFEFVSCELPVNMSWWYELPKITDNSQHKNQLTLFSGF